MNSTLDVHPDSPNAIGEDIPLTPVNFAALTLDGGEVDPDMYVTVESGKPSDPGHLEAGDNPIALDRMLPQLDDVEINDDDDRVVVIGNFERMGVWDPTEEKLDYYNQDQVAIIGISGAGNGYRVNWNTTFYGDRNTSTSTTDAYVCRDDGGDFSDGQQPLPGRHYLVRDLAIGNDGTTDYMVIGSTGGPDEDPANLGHADLSADHDGDTVASDPPVGCSMIARFDIEGGGLHVWPDWYNSTGGDSVYAVDIDDGIAIYEGGHQKFLENEDSIDDVPQCTGTASSSPPDPDGWISRGIGALTIGDGSTYTETVGGTEVLGWNPGRDPRGDRGVQALLVTETGVWVGSDTDFIGYKPCSGGGTDPRVFTGRLALFEP